MLVALYLCSTASANPSQRDVFRSIQDNVQETNNQSGKILMLMGGGAALLILLGVFSRSQKRQAAPKALRNPGKLLKEIRKSISLRNGEVKQLKIVAEQTSRGDGEPLSSPLVLLLCPSVLARAAQDRSSRADRKVVAQVVRKLIKR